MSDDVSYCWYDLFLKDGPLCVHSGLEWNLYHKINAKILLAYDPAPSGIRPLWVRVCAGCLVDRINEESIWP